MSAKPALAITMLSAALLGASPILAQQPAPANPLDAVPDKIPFDVIK